MPSERRHTYRLYVVLFYYMKFPEKANLQKQKSDVQLRPERKSRCRYRLETLRNTENMKYCIDRHNTLTQKQQESIFFQDTYKE